MNIIRNLFLAGIIIVLSLQIISCGEVEGSENKTSEKETKQISVSTLKVSADDYTDFITVLGVVNSRQRANLASFEGGKIKNVIKDKGALVKKGDTLIVMDNDIMKASLDAAAAQFDLDDINFKMQEQIYKENVNSQFQFLQAKYRREQSLANYEMAKSRYNKTFITAPFDGVVDKKYFEEGEFAAPGSPLVELIDITSYKVEAGVPERFIGEVKVGGSCLITFKPNSSEQVSGTITFVGSSIRADNRTFPIEVTLNTASNKLKSEMAAEILIKNSQYDKVFIIPEEVVTRIDNGYMIFIEENGIVKKRLIEILGRTGTNVAVKEGLSEGDNLITVGYQNLIEGQNVVVVNEGL